MNHNQVQSLINIEINAILEKYKVLLNESDTLKDEIIAEMFISAFIQYINGNLSSYDNVSKKYVRNQIVKIINEKIK